MGTAVDFYREKYVASSDERLALFTGLVERYAIESALYPGSLAHVTPSVAIPTVVHVDPDRRAERFFSDPEILELVRARREYEAEPTIRFHLGEYTSPFDEPEQSFDLLISQYAASVSQVCKRYLKVGGHLLVDNREGDADLAAQDPDYEIEAVYRRHGEVFSFFTTELDTYMFRDQDSPPTPAEIEQMVHGAGFARMASGAVLRRLR